MKFSPDVGNNPLNLPWMEKLGGCFAQVYFSPSVGLLYEQIPHIDMCFYAWYNLHGVGFKPVASCIQISCSTTEFPG